MSTERSHILKQTCSFQLQDCLSVCELLVDIRHWSVKNIKFSTCELTLICLLEKLNTHHFFLSTSIIFWNFTQDDIGQNIQEWTKENLWKIIFKKFERLWSALGIGHICVGLLCTAHILPLILTDLLTFYVRQIEHLITKYNHFYVY